jgi:hypothetical protein
VTLRPNRRPKSPRIRTRRSSTFSSSSTLAGPSPVPRVGEFYDRTKLAKVIKKRSQPTAVCAGSHFTHAKDSK